jgi:phosphotransferase system  glucose/maltose/N-acetylglucosamine-specific IIC component
MLYIGKKRDPIVVILLSIVTCGIYGIYWYYTAMVDLNGILGEERLNPVTFIILCIICPPVLYYVLYKIDSGLAQAAERERIYYKENFVLWLLLVLLLGIGVFVAIFQITGAYNRIWDNRAQSQYGNVQ